MRVRSACAVFMLWAIAAPALWGQTPPDLSGIWRLDPARSQMIGGTPDPSRFQLTWIVDHREPEITVGVNVRDERGSAEYSFRCTTDGRECVNELPALGETRWLSAHWEGSTLLMSQRAATRTGSFTAQDRIFLDPAGEQLTFERTVSNAQGDRHVRLIFRKLGPHPSQRPAPPPLPGLALPPELERVLRDYERHWYGGNTEALVSLFTEDGMIARGGGWVRGTAALSDGLQRTSSDLRLRAVAYSADQHTGWIIGNYGYGDQPGVPDRGMFILALRRGPDGRWLIAADLDGAIRPE